MQSAHPRAPLETDTKQKAQRDRPPIGRGSCGTTVDSRAALLKRSTSCGSLRLLRALGGTRILQAAAPTAPPCFGRWPRSSPLQTKGCSPLIIPKRMGSIQKIQVAALEDFLCCADFKSLTRRTVWQGCVFFLAKIMICKLFMNICDFSVKRIDFELYLLIAKLINALVAYLNASESAVFKHLALCKAEHTF